MSRPSNLVKLGIGTPAPNPRPRLLTPPVLARALDLQADYAAQLGQAVAQLQEALRASAETLRQIHRDDAAYLSERELAAYLSVDPSTIRRQLARADGAVEVLGIGTARRINVAEFVAFVKEASA